MDLGKRLCDTVLPYLKRRQETTDDDPPVLTLLERQEAVRLGVEPQGTLLTRENNI
jgi:hypothetical protein